LRVHTVIGVIGFCGLWVLGGGCGQEPPPSKPTTPVVKKIPKPQRPPNAQKVAVKPEDVSSTKPPEAPKGAKATAIPKEHKGPAAAEVAGAVTPASPKEQAAKEAPTNREPRLAYIYNPGDRPDPFRPFFIEKKTREPLPECRDMPIGPLTEQEATQFTIVAVVRRGGESLAMVQDAQGKGYMLRRGTYVGKNCGRVSSIGPDGVTIEEPYEDLLGERKVRKITLEFKRAEGGGK
jgi:type IV pilus assembly protein PilP